MTTLQVRSGSTARVRKAPDAGADAPQLTGSLTACRSCRGGRLHMFLPMGVQPPANAFVAPERLHLPEPSASLDALACLDCGLVQVPYKLPPDYFRHYVYIPSASATLHKHFSGLADTLWERLLGAPDALAIDVGSNDGLMLSYLKARGGRTLGVEPAANLAEVARGKGLEVVNDYFTPETAQRLRRQYGAARVVATTNTFNHIDDLHSFVRGVVDILEPGGAFVVEVPHLQACLARNEFDTIYHEHLSTFSLTSFVELFRHFDMEVFSLELLDIHGGSMRVYGRAASGPTPSCPEVAACLAREREAGLFDRLTYDRFRESIDRNRDRTLDLLWDLKRQGKRIAAYGASARGNTLLNYYGIGPDLLDYVVDKNPLKQGLYSPGSRLPVYPVERLTADRPDYLLVLAWNFGAEIFEQQAAYRALGGRFILPLPEVEVVA
ncbi:MAG: class I SAM-dependent methyltransferase [Gemmataceae bacterium]